MRLAPRPLAARSRFLTALAAAATLGIAGLVAAPSASATDHAFTTTCPSGGIVQQPVTMAVGDTVTVTATAGGACVSVSGGPDLPGVGNVTIDGVPALLNQVNPIDASSTAVVVVFTATAAGGSSALRSFSVFNGAPPGGLTIGLTVTGGGGGSSGSGSAAVPTPATLSLAIDTAGSAGGAVCTSGSEATGYAGQWLTLPGQSDCSVPSVPSARLLGWATTTDFPMAIAQRQADNGWGAYQVVNEAGQITAVFIPAGHAVLVTGNNTLFPIWAK